ncbi:PH domain-containing protein [Neobacillus niacini]|uniref:PH domain-containing protein n=1 Tax=Neobacillus niacini TaxID=86668 RepID=UPI0021CB4ABB|nr:PH domain-containing protein [Neobacillus niacini]MCM3768036.1 PH domain-containing protein [Neobacillus niacini]
MLTEPQNRISPKALTVWRISGVIRAVIEWSIAATAIVLLHIFQGPQWISIILIILGVIFTILHILIFPSLRWKRWRYEVREEELELQEGIFIRTRTLVPMVRVQHVDTVQGPILRKYKLASVIVHTAATMHTIPALDETEAEELRHYISKLARVVEEDV